MEPISSNVTGPRSTGTQPRSKLKTDQIYEFHLWIISFMNLKKISPSKSPWEGKTCNCFGSILFLHQKSFGYNIATLLSRASLTISRASLNALRSTKSIGTGTPNACIIWNDIIPTKTKPWHLEAKNRKEAAFAARLPPPIWIVWEINGE